MRFTIKSLEKSVKNSLGVTLSCLIIDILVRILLILFLIGLGTYVQSMVEIDPNLAYKYSYPTSLGPKVTVSSTMLGLIVVLMVLAVVILNHVLLRVTGSSQHKTISIDIYHFLMAATMAGLSTMTFVLCLKLWVRRPRPDFLSRCYPHGYDIRHWKRIPECTRPLNNPIINDGLQSFPSGHSAASWSTSVFCFLYLTDHYKHSHYRSHSHIPRCIPYIGAFFLAIFACYVSCSRLTDNAHHPEDIIAGALIGCFLTCLSFFLYYPIHSLKIPVNKKSTYKDPSPENDEARTLLV